MMKKEEYQQILNDLCAEYNLVPIEVIFDAEKLTKKESGGQYNWHLGDYGTIVIDPSLEQEGIDLLEVLFHEFRHYWQRMYFPDIFFWWCCESNGLYKKYYNTILCSIEEDARVFGETRGASNRCDLLEMYDVETLSSLRDDERILHLTLQFLELE